MFDSSVSDYVKTHTDMTNYGFDNQHTYDNLQEYNTNNTNTITGIPNTNMYYNNQFELENLNQQDDESSDYTSKIDKSFVMKDSSILRIK